MTDEQGIQFSTQWLWDMTSQPQPVNQIVVQGDVPLQNGRSGELHYLTFGNVNSPLIIGDVNDPDVIAQHNGTVLPIVPVVKLAVTRERLKEFSDVISKWLIQTEAPEADA